jgi:chemotaxis protein MotB
MPEGPDGKTIIIVKKVSGHGGAHGGAWKVAYADFVTAMMALFMVLWLVNSAAEPTRQRIASYFRKPGIFQKGSGTPMEMGGGGILPEAFSPPADGNAQIQASDKIYDVNAQTGRVKELYDPGDGSKDFHYAPKLQGDSSRGISEKDVFEKSSDQKSNEIKSEEEKLAELKTEIEKAIESKNSENPTEGVLGDIEIKIDQRGLVIEIMDTDKTSMFASGQAVILPEAGRKLDEIGKILYKVSNPIDIEGHTDGNPFKSARKDKYDNWNLSMDRANAARRTLESSGFARSQIARVVGYADQRLKDPTNPLNSANRRITISMRFSNRAKVALDGKKIFETSTENKNLKPIPENKVEVVKEIKKPFAELEAIQDLEIKDNLEEKIKEESKNNSGLKVEVSTIVPESSEKDETSGTVVEENKKSLIFESTDAFFKK